MGRGVLASAKGQLFSAGSPVSHRPGGYRYHLRRTSLLLSMVVVMGFMHMLESQVVMRYV